MQDKHNLSIFDKAIRKAHNKGRKCLIDGCDNTAIKSHTLQKNGILKPVSVKNHLYQFSNTNAFHIESKGPFEFKKIGINDAYTFPGFCKKHDLYIFKKIEGNEIDFFSEESINLFSYRALCQEIRRKEIVLDIANEIISTSDILDIIMSFTEFKRGLMHGLNNLNFFKKELEEDINRIEKKFEYKITTIPKLDLCISVPFNIYDKNNISTYADLTKLTPYVTSFLNIFPYKDKSYVMIAYHKEFKCNWTNNIFEKIQTSRKGEYLKIISDLISARLEFWCISPSLKSQIGEQKIDLLKDIWVKYLDYYDKEDIKIDFNLFE